VDAVVKEPGCVGEVEDVDEGRCEPVSGGWGEDLSIQRAGDFDSFEEKGPCPSSCGNNGLENEAGCETKGESVVKGSYADENSTVDSEICTDVAYFLGSHMQERESHTSGVVVVMVNANTMMDNDRAGGRGMAQRVPFTTYPSCLT
jgi:hypothetical protein